MNISITGSKGKTTILKLLENLLISYCQNKFILTSSSTEGMYLNGNFIRELNAENYLVTLDAKNCQIKYDYFISEATSFLLSQGYYNIINTDIAVFTGIEEFEHLDVHKTFRHYLNSKKILFDKLRNDSTAIINNDDNSSKYILSDCPSKNIITYGTSSESDYKIVIDSLNAKEMIFRINNQKIKTKLLGDYNARNVTAAFIISKLLSLDSFHSINFLENFNGVEGRFQRLLTSKNNIIIIDYAHTPNSLAKVLELTKTIYRQHKIISIFGCGGDKCQEKRPLMGKIATELSDFVYITSDNPRYENKEKIINDIQQGIQKSNFKTIVERKQAIESALLENESSVILISGKGSERKRIESRDSINITCPNCKNNFAHNIGQKILYSFNESDLDIVYEIICKYKFDILTQ